MSSKNFYFCLNQSASNWSTLPFSLTVHFPYVGVLNLPFFVPAVTQTVFSIALPLKPSTCWYQFIKWYQYDLCFCVNSTVFNVFSSLLFPVPKKKHFDFNESVQPVFQFLYKTVMFTVCQKKYLLIRFVSNSVFNQFSSMNVKASSWDFWF